MFGAQPTAHFFGSNQIVTNRPHPANLNPERKQLKPRMDFDATEPQPNLLTVLFHSEEISCADHFFRPSAAFGFPGPLRLVLPTQPRLRQMGAVKAIGRDAALRVAEMESTRESVSPEWQPTHQIGGSLNYYRLPRRTSEIEAELAAAEA